MVAVVFGVLLLAATGVLVAVAGSRAPESTYVSSTERAEAFRALVKRRSDAIVNKDEQAWLADVDPSRPELLERERMRFRNWTRLPLASFRLSTTVLDIPESDRPRLHAVRLDLRFTGDPSEQTIEYGYQIQFQGKVPKLLAVQHDELFASQVRRTLVPWDLEPLRITQRGRVTVISGANSRWDPDDYLDVASRAADRVLTLWGDREGTKHFLVHLADRRQYLSWFGYELMGGDASSWGHTNCQSPVNEDLRADSRGMGTCLVVLNMSAIRSRDDVYHTMAHEMAHAVAPHAISMFVGGGQNPATRTLGSALWVSEGFAEWVALRARGPSAIRAASRDVRRNWSRYARSAGVGRTQLPENDDFYADDRAAFNYSASAMFFEAVDRVAGRDAVLEFYLRTAHTSHQFLYWRGDINAQLGRVGVDGDRVWRTYRSLVEP
jgi:hypothetical protein